MKKPDSSIRTSFAEINPGGQQKSGARFLPAEVPVALTYNGVSHVVMMASPANLEEFGLGFSLSEQIILSRDELKSCTVKEHPKGAVIDMEIPKSGFKKLLDQDRNLVGQTGCGLCGVAEMEAAVRSYPKIRKGLSVSDDALFCAFKNLPEMQTVNQQTRAVHAAAFCDAQGNILKIREDVGRHNAFDKLIGALALEKVSFEEGFALLTSRCSFELVQKALALKIPMLVAISAPTTLAVDLAKAHDLTLIALARPDSFQIYNDPFGVFEA